MIVKLISVSVRDGNRPVLTEASFSFGESQIYLLKVKERSEGTAILRAIIEPETLEGGRVEIDEKSLGSNVQSGIGYVSSSPAFVPGWTAYENLLSMASIRGVACEKWIVKAMKDMGLNCEDRRPVRKFSADQLFRLEIARAVMAHPALLLLDTPFEHRGFFGMKELLVQIETARKSGAIVIATSCGFDFDYVASSVVTVDSGKMAEMQNDATFCCC